MAFNYIYALDILRHHLNDCDGVTSNILTAPRAESEAMWVQKDGKPFFAIIVASESPDCGWCVCRTDSDWMLNGTITHFRRIDEVAEFIKSKIKQ
jgi:hypothetical protein